MSAEYRPQEVREILERGLDGVSGREVRCEALVDRRQLADPAPHDPERGERRLVALVQGLIRVGAQALQLVGVCEDLPRGGELVVFAGLRLDAIDLGELEGDELGARRTLALARQEAVPFCGELLPRGERFSDLEPLRFEPRVGVEHVEVRGRVEQHLVLVLPMEVDERAGELAQRGARHEGAVDERAASSLRRHFPAHDDLAAVGGVEDGFDRSGFLAGAHELGRGAAADEQANGAEEDGLAGAGFAG